MAAALLDTNVLVHAAYQRAPLHGQAREILDRALKERARYCIAPQNLVEFAAVVSRRRLVHEPLPADDVAHFVRVLYHSRNLKKIYPKRATVMRAIREGAALGITGPVWYDMFLAVTMRDAGVSRIVTEDNAHYQRFPFVTALGIAEESVK
ncbi:MAG: type II toxin-antitoxin system VapC family toxin [Planctomycetes bacterium]|nr:type II toxin-antitoxin system VapC family toxin [Planctomycetota bacterium]